jgi:starvation-inducible DNA-binding protein
VLQTCLYDLIDLALQGKQAHWNVVGTQFRSVHLELDEIIASVREASDDVAERIATLGISPDGRASIVGERTRLKSFPEGLQTASATVTIYSDRLSSTVDGIREGISAVASHDPVSEDLLIGIAGRLEKHLWMLQSQEI